MAYAGLCLLIGVGGGGGEKTLNCEYEQGRTLSTVVQYSHWIKQFLTWKEENGSGVEYTPRKREGAPGNLFKYLYIFINEFKPLIIIIRGVH